LDVYRDWLPLLQRLLCSKREGAEYGIYHLGLAMKEDWVKPRTTPRNVVMHLRRLVSVSLLVLAIGCSKKKSEQDGVGRESDGLPPPSMGGKSDNSEEGDKEALRESRILADSYKNSLTVRQLALNQENPSKYPLAQGGQKKWQPHYMFREDKTYADLLKKLDALVAKHNAILDRHPTWATPRLRAELD
jgi:hypothetical protein